MKDDLIAVSRNYNELMPPGREALLLLILLYNRVETGELEEEFLNRDLEEAIEDIADLLQLDKAIQKETLSKKLSGFFYQTISRNNTYYIRLTVYAKDLCKLVVDRISPEVIKDLQLAHVFRRTLHLSGDDFENIATFNHWYSNHFTVGRKPIIAFTEILLNSVEGSISELKSLLKPEVSDLRELIKNFEKIFNDLSIQASGLAATLKAKDEILSQIKSCKSKFSKNESDFTQFLKIQEDVVYFFETISSQINSINEKIQLASKKLSNLLETLKHKQVYKVRIERFMHELLVASQFSRDGFFLPSKFPRRLLPEFRNKFISIPMNDYKARKHVLPDSFEIDDEHLTAEKERNYQMLLIQERTAKWINLIKTEMSNGSEIIMEDWISQIIHDENSLEIPIAVCYGLLQSIPDDYKLTIENKLAELRDYNLKLWKMRISPILS